MEEVPKTKLGDLWQLGKHRLLCGSSTEQKDVDKLLDGQHSKLLFTSPPYSDMREYNGNKDLSVENISTFIDRYKSYADIQAVNLGIQRKKTRDCSILERVHRSCKTMWTQVACVECVG